VHYNSPTSKVPYGSRGRTVTGSPIDASLSIVAAVDGPLVSFAMGSPGGDVVPADEIAALSAELLESGRRQVSLDYTPTEGDPGLRTALTGRLRDDGLSVEPGNLLITAGAMQGLDLVARLFVEHGDLVVVESPSYPNGLATLRNHGARLLPVPVDADGLIPEILEERLAAAQQSPRLIYTIPSFQNPSGALASKSRRLELLEIARRFGALILEDDPFSELRYGEDRLPSLLELDGGQGWVVQVRTFSKIVAPGLRVGWVVAPSDTIVRMVQAKQSMDTCANSLAQGILRLFIETGGLDTHIRRLRIVYAQRRDMMLRALGRAFGGFPGVSWSRPAGGLFVWLGLPEAASGDMVAATALRRGVSVMPGSAFTLRADEPALRLCFAAAQTMDIDRGVSALSEAFDEVNTGLVKSSLA
jgi:2-aminoadipate transaminase